MVLSKDTIVILLTIVICFLTIFIIVQNCRFLILKKKIRNEAVKKSRAVIGGQMIEQVAPFLPDFPCNPSDARFVGKPVDFVAFPGLMTDDKVEEVLLIEVKTGSSALSAREKEIRKAVEEGRVRYVEYRMN